MEIRLPALGIAEFFQARSPTHAMPYNSGNERGGAQVNKGSGLAVGIALGVALGVALGNIALGIAIGVALGITMGGASLRKPPRENK